MFKIARMDRFSFTHFETIKFFICTSLLEKLLTIKASRMVGFDRYVRNTVTTFKIAQMDRFSFAHFETIRFFVCTSLVTKLLTIEISRTVGFGR